jgi:glutathione S-transferase
VQGGGRATVPCLKIRRGDEVEWLYESRDIIDYLDRRRRQGG